MKDARQHNAVQQFRLTTEEFASQNLVKAQTVRKQYAATGSYHGVRPVRLPNRRLLWPSDSIQRLIFNCHEEAEGS